MVSSVTSPRPSLEMNARDVTNPVVSVTVETGNAYVRNERAAPVPFPGPAPPCRNWDLTSLLRWENREGLDLDQPLGVHQRMNPDG